MRRFDTLKGWLAWQESLHPLAIDMGLDRAAAVFFRLNPDYVKPITITVAGTNGKGSCVAYLEAIYLAQGYKVGAYTSPHILKYNERIKIGGLPVPDATICDAFSRIESVRGDTTLSYFEFGTLAALDIFSKSEVDVQLLEVGMGGRLDAVNIVDPDVSLISSIGIDHVDWLGKTRETIGLEKAGIFRPGTPAIVGDPSPPRSVIQHAKDRNARLACIIEDFWYEKTQSGWNWFAGDGQLLNLPEPAMKGEHQYRNASAALFAATRLQASLPVSEASIRHGLATTHLPGRFQLIDGKIPLLLDVGHNPQAVNTLAEYLLKHFPGKRILAVFAMMKDKDIAGVLEIMKPFVHDWFFAPLSNPRTVSETTLHTLFSNQSIERISMGFKDFSEAFAAAKSQAQEGDLLLVFGSFFLVSDCLAELNKK
ncbi:MAG: bifunctional tetrahydrofolate synthase/dihydrofolate synthase [Gammaproteobacteria bacterium]